MDGGVIIKECIGVVLLIFILIETLGSVGWWEWQNKKMEICRKRCKKQPPKSGLGDRQVGAFSVFRARHTGIPFIFRPKSLFFRKICRFRGWCNTTPSVCRDRDLWA